MNKPYIKVTYTERRFIDRYSCIDTQHTLIARSKFTQGGLTYYKINDFEYKVIETDFVIKEENLR